jgi:hypothetical protein
MALKGQMSRAMLNLSLLALNISLAFHFIPLSTSEGIGSRSKNFRDFSNSLERGGTDILRGVYVSNTLALPIVQQPAGDSNYVSGKNGEATQFATASQYGNIGLLAHNFLSGKSFSQLAIGQEVRLLFDDGHVEYFVISEILRYKALEPGNPYSNFQNLSNQDEILSAGEMFNRVYVGKHHVTFQTCIAADGKSSWGRLFVVALPKPKHLGLSSWNAYDFPRDFSLNGGHLP